MAALNFNAANVDPTQPSFGPVPAGNYPVIIEESEMKPTKDMMGQYLNLKMSILDGQYKDRKIFARLNLVNQNVQAVEIAQRQLSQLCHSIGKLQVQDSYELHNIPFIVRVTVRKNNTTGDDTNEVREFKPMSGTIHPAPTTFPQQSQGGYAPPPPAAQPPATGKPAWAR